MYFSNTFLIQTFLSSGILQDGKAFRRISNIRRLAVKSWKEAMWETLCF